MPVRHAVLLVGGRGTRLWPLTATTPKALLPVAGRPFLDYQLAAVAAVGVEVAYLAVGREHESRWAKYAADRSDAPHVELAFEDEPLDTAGPVMAIRDQLDERFLVLNGDVMFDTPLQSFVDGAPDSIAVLALAEVADPSHYGVVVTNDVGRVERFVEKPEPGTAPANTVSAGVYMVRQEALDGFESGPLSFERRVFPEIAARGDLFALTVSGEWIDIGTPHLYLEAHESVLSGATSFGEQVGHSVDPTASVDGTLSGGWSWIGAGAIVESGAVVKESLVLPGAAIRAGARVSDAIIGWDAQILQGAVVAAETMVGQGAEVGEGCELRAGMRISPGTKLGPRAVTFAPPA